jgi:hypothetical protein
VRVPDLRCRVRPRTEVTLQKCGPRKRAWLDNNLEAGLKAKVPNNPGAVKQMSEYPEWFLPGHKEHAQRRGFDEVTP